MAIPAATRTLEKVSLDIHSSVAGIPVATIATRLAGSSSPAAVPCLPAAVSVRGSNRRACGLTPFQHLKPFKGEYCISPARAPGGGLPHASGGCRPWNGRRHRRQKPTRSEADAVRSRLDQKPTRSEADVQDDSRGPRWGRVGLDVGDSGCRLAAKARHLSSPAIDRSGCARLRPRVAVNPALLPQRTGHQLEQSQVALDPVPVATNDLVPDL